MTRADVRSSLLRARVTFDFPSATSASAPGTEPVITPQSVDDLLPATTTEPTAPPKPVPGSGTPRKQVVTAAERSLTVQALIAAGVVPADLPVAVGGRAGRQADRAGSRRWQPTGGVLAGPGAVR